MIKFFKKNRLPLPDKGGVSEARAAERRLQEATKIIDQLHGVTEQLRQETARNHFAERIQLSIKGTM